MRQIVALNSDGIVRSSFKANTEETERGLCLKNTSVTEFLVKKRMELEFKRWLFWLYENYM